MIRLSVRQWGVFPVPMERLSTTRAAFEEVADGVYLADLQTGERAGMVYWRIESGATLPSHTHANEQIGFVLEGNSPQSSRARSTRSRPATRTCSGATSATARKIGVARTRSGSGYSHRPARSPTGDGHPPRPNRAEPGSAFGRDSEPRLTARVRRADPAARCRPGSSPDGGNRYRAPTRGPRGRTADRRRRRGRSRAER